MTLNFLLMLFRKGICLTKSSSNIEAIDNFLLAEKEAKKQYRFYYK
jgi:hypothetical protein